MIYTLTLNPSIDYITRLDNLKLGEVNRLSSDEKVPGGKGINVSRILNRLDTPNTALGYLGGFTGNFIENTLKQEQITTQFIQVEEDTRINIKLKAEVETEINGQGPVISEEKQQELINYLKENLTSKDLVVLAGSLSRGLPTDFYLTLIKLITDLNAQFIIDTTGQKLLDSLASNPLLVKPNHHELAEMFETSFNNISDILPFGKKLLSMGAKYAIISMAGDGALFFTKAGSYFAKPIKGTIQNSVGAGDSMIAGFTSGLTKTNDPIQAFKLGVACGTATAFSKDLADLTTINRYLEQVEIEKLN